MPTDRIERPKRGKNNPLSFSCTGCPVVENGEKCGETKTLDIINEFKKLYEDKMEQIDSQGAGDCTQAKLSLQQDWIRDLTEQNELLVRAVEELEQEATDRVHNLQQKLYRIESSRDKLQDDLRKLKESKASIEKSMLDMRNALTAEIAEKHDTILSLRRDIQQLEERCLQADKQTHFKDDIIKELRKEIKQLKREKTEQPVKISKPTSFKNNTEQQVEEFYFHKNFNDSPMLTIKNFGKQIPSNSTVIYIQENSKSHSHSPEKYMVNVNAELNSPGSSNKHECLNINDIKKFCSPKKTVHHITSQILDNLEHTKNECKKLVNVGKPIKLPRSKLTVPCDHQCNHVQCNIEEVFKNIQTFETEVIDSQRSNNSCTASRKTHVDTCDSDSRIKKDNIVTESGHWSCMNNSI